MKKAMIILLSCIIICTHVLATHAAPVDNDSDSHMIELELTNELTRYFNSRKLLLANGDTKALLAVTFEGIVNDEVRHYSSSRALVYSDKYKVIRFNIGEDAIVNVEEETLAGPVLHEILLFRREESGWMVVSDRYSNQYDGFTSASYVNPEDIQAIETMLRNQTEARYIPLGGEGLRMTLLNTANNEVGYLEKASNSNLYSHTANPGNNNYTKYGAWYGSNPADWCAMFVSWCANQAGISTSIIPRTDSVQTGINAFTSWGRYHAAASYTPVAGDVFFMKIPGVISHTGLVYAQSGNTVLIIDGNASVSGSSYQQVRKIYLSLTDYHLTGYGHPNYCYGNNHSASGSYSSNLYTHWHPCTLCGTRVAEASHSWISSGTGYTCSVCNKHVTAIPAE